MVQLLLVLNLLAVFLLFLAIGTLFYSLKRVVEKTEELEVEQIKLSGKFNELKTAVEKLESSIEFLQNQVKILLTGLRRRE